MKNRVECDRCINFINPIFENNDKGWHIKEITKAQCELGKRVMFRMPKFMYDENSGYWRYCENFKKRNL